MEVKTRIKQVQINKIILQVSKWDDNNYKLVWYRVHQQILYNQKLNIVVI